jgi:hypothetical protein
MKVLTGSICIDDLDKSAIVTASNGKRYISINVVERKKVGKFGETHFISQYVKGAEQNLIIGNMKPLSGANSGGGVAPTDDDPFA